MYVYQTYIRSCTSTYLQQLGHRLTRVGLRPYHSHPRLLDCINRDCLHRDHQLIRCRWSTFANRIQNHILSFQRKVRVFRMTHLLFWFACLLLSRKSTGGWRNAWALCCLDVGDCLMMSGHRRRPEKLFFILSILFILSIPTSPITQPPQSLFNISTNPNNTKTMQMTTTPTFNVRSSTAGHSAHRHEASSRVSRSGVALLSNNGSTNRVLNTAEDARACDVNFSRRCLSHNQGIVDKRYKAIHRRLYEKVQQRNIQRHIDHLD